MGYRTGLAVLASAHPKPGHPAAPHPWWTASWTPVVVGVCGLVGLCILVWGIPRRRARRQEGQQQAGHPRRDLLGWALILAFWVGSSLLMVHVQVSSGLTLVVTSLACILPPGIALWLERKNPGASRHELAALIGALNAGQANGRAAPATQDTDQSGAADNVAVLRPADRGEAAETDSATLADARQTVQALRAQVATLRSRVLSAVLKYGPDEDWRLLLAVPRYQLESCTSLLDQLDQTRNQWADFGATSFAFTDTLAATRRAAASLSEAIEERTAGRPAGTDLAEAARRLDHVAGRLAVLLDNAAPGP